MKYLTTLVFALAAACGSSDSPGGGADADPSAPDANPNAPDAGSDDWATLITGNWTMSAGTEGYRCTRLTVTEDLYITGFRAINPNGTHHTVLTVGSPSGADGTSSCSAGTNADTMIFGSGVGPDAEMHLPAGVGMKVTAGQQLVLNLHLFNTTDAEISGLSGTEVITVPAAQVQNVAEAILMGPTVTLSIPPNQVSTQNGSCTMNGDVTLFAVGPHMHQLGTHMKVVAESSVDGTVTVHDGPYDFYEQKLYSIDSISMNQGDKIQVSCTYDNDTGSTVTFGDSSTEEMCFATMYRYPAFGSQLGIACSF
jgi:hypothetical protein